ncbi:hypothetical protein [Gallaecimonas mangrovi]|uniref:hypothetical protein n=1 Tax=Gallaecimonas mangrovi TaxID=2291597 RepID=UPI000E202718|nr:hypothetical protein [Gallaecimonas mangrovi]
MAAGMQLWLQGSSSVFQIDGSNQNIQFKRKVTLTLAETTMTSGQWSGTVYLGSTSISDSEIYAVQSPVFVCVTARRNGAIEFQAAEQGTVTVYIFGPGSQESDFGCQVFDDDGSLVYDAIAKPMIVKGVFSGTGSFSSTGTIAVMPAQIHTRLTRASNLESPGSGKVWLQIAAWNSDSIKNTSNSDFTVSFETIGGFAYGPTETPIAYWDKVVDNGLTSLNLAVDVANL